MKRYDGNKNMVICYKGKRHLIKPGQVIDIPDAALKRMSQRARALFRDQVSQDDRIRILERRLEEALSRG